MGDILGVGLTHFPGFLGPDENVAYQFFKVLGTDRVSPQMKDPRNWPEGARTEWGTDRGATAAKLHRERIIGGFRRIRRRLDEFKPDFLLVWGDDQYEQFREDCVPPFNIFIFDELACQPFLVDHMSNPGARNIWSEPVDKVFRIAGHSQGAGYLIHQLIERNFDVAYSYRMRDKQPLPRSFLNTLLYLDYDRTGFGIPVVPFHVNCYGSTVIRSRGLLDHLLDRAGVKLDPISPTPRRCFELGRVTARILKESPWRVAVVASSSWSHAFLTPKHSWLFPDWEADRQRFEVLKAERYDAYRDLSVKELEDTGQHEFLNWICLAGALSELGHRAEFLDYVESYLFNSNKCMALFSST